MHATELDFFTDPAKGEDLGMGGVYGSQWFFAKWEPAYIRSCDPSIGYLELLALCTGVFIWSHKLRNKHMIVFTDNQSVVQMVNETSSKCKNCMHLIRKLTARSLYYNMRIFAKWVQGAVNIRADLFK